MRLANETITLLANLAKLHFGESAELRLFGSRADDRARGGDIDLHVVAPNSSYRDEIAFLVDVEGRLDERVDLRVQRGEELLIDRLAHKNGIILNG
ncbi:MAG: nucleotidyltransferase domain-containing protein [Rhodocyclales bacterium]|nr:nucleotidyltransferase domain-containing protein [Rhodocyclales bacterium]MBI5786317.1 nucleotidyltransferase domain-containing protein [Rhodocyclales bacterium]